MQLMHKINNVLACANLTINLVFILMVGPSSIELKFEDMLLERIVLTVWIDPTSLKQGDTAPQQTTSCCNVYNFSNQYLVLNVGFLSCSVTGWQKYSCGLCKQRREGNQKCSGQVIASYSSFFNSSTGGFFKQFVS